MDPISDMLIRIKNALMVKKESCSLPASKTKIAIARILKDKKFIEDFEKKQKSNQQPLLKIKLRYIKGYPAISEVQRISHLKRRVYEKYRDIKIPKMGIIIISTSKGIMTARDAKKNKLGGEILCKLR